MLSRPKARRPAFQAAGAKDGVESADHNRKWSAGFDAPGGLAEFRNALPV
jgi:hypothetical protein